jgi:hypothetical protein
MHAQVGDVREVSLGDREAAFKAREEVLVAGAPTAAARRRRRRRRLWEPSDSCRRSEAQCGAAWRRDELACAGIGLHGMMRNARRMAPLYATPCAAQARTGWHWTGVRPTRLACTCLRRSARSRHAQPRADAAQPPRRPVRRCGRAVRAASSSAAVHVAAAAQAGLADLKRNAADERSRLAKESARLEALQVNASGHHRRKAHVHAAHGSCRGFGCRRWPFPLSSVPT